MNLESVDDLQEALRSQTYIADRGLAMSIYLSLKLKRPLFLEGEAGVGKTEVAKVIAGIQNTELIRLQCYEGLDIYHAVYEWNYTRQMLHIRLLEAQGEKPSETELFGPEYLLRRPLLRALDSTGGAPPVLLIDEIDRSDEEFEAYLLEVLSDYQITIPEIGTIEASQPPIVILTSNRTREVHDALKRRCLYYWIDYPTFDKELEIVRAKVPEASQRLACQVTSFIQELRQIDLYKLPGVAETLEWTAALVALDQEVLEPSVVDDTLGVILKYRDDISLVKGNGSRNILDAMPKDGR
jgi:MoxR-like ATPase